jgi:TFIIF-interacting CTD phosphatase-like protein
VVVIETNPERLKYQKENGIYLKEFTGNTDDKALFELLPFLECYIFLFI